MIGRVGNDVMGHSSLSSLQSKGVKLNENEAMVVGAHSTGVAVQNMSVVVLVLIIWP